jgi:hypothetical protein
MTYKPRSERKRARGGKAEGQPITAEHGHQYNAQGSPEAAEEDAKSDGFHRGGMMPRKKKAGGKVEGREAKHHLGKRARGGATPAHIDLHMAEHHEHDGHDGPHHGEHTDGERPDHGHHQHRARGGHVKAMARGGSPFSAARKTTDFQDDKKTGPGEQAPTIP